MLLTVIVTATSGGIGGSGLIGMVLATAKLADTAKTVPNTTLGNFNEVKIMDYAPCV